MVQVENELGFSSYPYTEYLRGFYDMILPGLLFQTIEFGSDIAGNFGKLEKMQPNKPVMAMEFYSGWADHWTEQHHTTDLTDFRDNYEQALAWPGFGEFVHVSWWNKLWFYELSQ
jgi:hypothetical protein